MLLLFCDKVIHVPAKCTTKICKSLSKQTVTVEKLYCSMLQADFKFSIPSL